MSASRSGPDRITRAVVTKSDGTSELRELPLADPARGEFVLRLEACGLCGTDLVKIDQRRRGLGADRESAAEPEPVVLGHELVGRVEHVGDDAGWQVGERVVVAHHVPCGQCRLCREGAETSCSAYRENLLVPGGFSERILIRDRAARHSTFVFDDDYDASDLVFLEPLACVLRSLDRAQLPADGRVLILGAGSMGLLHLLALQATRPEVECTLIDRDPDRRALAREFDAHGTAAEPPATGALEVDAVFDTVGSPELLDRALRMARPGSRAVLFAHGPLGEDLQLDFHHLFRNELTVTSSYSSGRTDQIRAHELLAARRIQPGRLVTHRFALSQFDEAIQSVQNREAVKAILHA